MRSRRMGKMLGLILAMAFCICAIPRQGLTAGIQAQIDVAPNVLNIQNQGTVVTVHTDLAYGLVVGSSVTINEIPILFWKADAQGNFVAKFDIEQVKKLDGLKIGDYNTLTLFGYTNQRDTFIGSQQIKVVDILPNGK